MNTKVLIVPPHEPNERSAIQEAIVAEALRRANDQLAALEQPPVKVEYDSFGRVLQNMDETAAQCGVHKQTLYKWIAVRHFPNPIKIGLHGARQNRWDRKEVDEWLRAQ